MSPERIHQPTPGRSTYKPEAISKVVDLHDVHLQRHGGRVVFAQSATPRKVILSLPRVRWLERA
jgi:hypothetical protein